MQATRPFGTGWGRLALRMQIAPKRVNPASRSRVATAAFRTASTTLTALKAPPASSTPTASSTVFCSAWTSPIATSVVRPSSKRIALRASSSSAGRKPPRSAFLRLARRSFPSLLLDDEGDATVLGEVLRVLARGERSSSATALQAGEVGTVPGDARRSDAGRRRNKLC